MFSTFTKSKSKFFNVESLRTKFKSFDQRMKILMTHVLKFRFLKLKLNYFFQHFHAFHIVFDFDFAVFESFQFNQKWEIDISTFAACNQTFFFIRFSNFINFYYIFKWRFFQNLFCYFFANWHVWWIFILFDRQISFSFENFLKNYRFDYWFDIVRNTSEVFWFSKICFEKTNFFERMRSRFNNS